MHNAYTCNPFEKAFYRPIDAAIRWCGLMAHETQILESAGDCPGLLSKKFPQWPCLAINTEKIFDAARNHEIPYGYLGVTTQLSTLIDCRFLTVRHADLKWWMLHHHPEQRPIFLYGEKSDDKEKISIDTYLTLHADRDALKVLLRASENTHKTLLDELSAIGLERDHLHSFVETHRKLSTRSEASYLCVIGALLETLLGFSPSGSPNSVFKTQASVVDSITAHYEDIPGLSKRSLDEKFAAARRSLSRT